MKPIIIYQETKDGKIVLTKEEFEKYLEDAYQAGYSDGSSSLTYKSYTWTPDDVYEKYPTWKSTSDYKAPEVTVTCTSTN